MARNIKSDTNQRDSGHSERNDELRGPDGRTGYKDAAGNEKGKQKSWFRTSEKVIVPGVTIKVVELAATMHLDLSPLRVEPGLFKDETEYERVTNNVVARIRSGEIQPRESEQDEE